MFKKAKENKKGFTLAELLIVVAIIAVLVAISIPIFNSQLEKSRDAVTAANLRAAYAEAATDILTEKPSTSGPVVQNGNTLVVTISGVKIKGTKAGGVGISDFDFPFAIASGVDFGIQPTGYSETTGVNVTFTYSADANGNVSDTKPTAAITNN